MSVKARCLAIHLAIKCILTSLISTKQHVMLCQCVQLFHDHSTSSSSQTASQVIHYQNITELLNFYSSVFKTSPVVQAAYSFALSHYLKFQHNFPRSLEWK